MKQVDGNRRRARWAKNTSSGTSPGTATIRHPVAASRTLLSRRKSGIPSASTPSPPSPSRYSRQARLASSRCWRSKSSRQIACSSSLYSCQFCSIVDSAIRSRWVPVIDISELRALPRVMCRLSNVNARAADQLRAIGSSSLLWKAILRDLAQPLDEVSHVFDQLREARLSPVASLIHVKRSVDLDLQCVPVRAGAPVKAGREPAGIGCVDRDDKAALNEKTGGSLDDLRG